MRLIDFDAAAERVCAETIKGEPQLMGLHGPLVYASEVERILNIFAEMPTVDAEPVRHGRWISEPRFGNWIDAESECGYTPGFKNLPVCSACGWRYGLSAFEFLHCPNCGAKMDLEVNNALD